MSLYNGDPAGIRISSGYRKGALFSASSINRAICLSGIPVTPWCST